jgi:hypothetical protein
MKKHLFPVLILLLFVACSYGQSNIRSVDFKNFTYAAHCAGAKPSSMKVTDGEFLEEKQMEGYTDRMSFTVMDVAYGDLNADRSDEAVILTVCNTGGTGNFSEGFVYAMKRGKPSLVARIPGGDRAYGGLRKAWVENGLLVLDINDAGTEGAACCPQYILTAKYRLGPRGGILKAGKESRREIYPSERVAFTKGASGKTFKTTIRAEEGRRFIIGARAGQTLSVSIDTDKASLRLLEEADVKFGINNFMVKLPKNGDYTIELQNDADTDLEITVNIKIQ